jgi:hypothetical protein
MRMRAAGLVLDTTMTSAKFPLYFRSYCLNKSVCILDDYHEVSKAGSRRARGQHCDLPCRNSSGPRTTTRDRAALGCLFGDAACKQVERWCGHEDPHARKKRNENCFACPSTRSAMRDKGVRRDLSMKRPFTCHRSILSILQDLHANWIGRAMSTLLTLSSFGRRSRAFLKDGMICRCRLGSGQGNYSLESLPLCRVPCMVFLHWTVLYITQTTTPCPQTSA